MSSNSRRSEPDAILRLDSVAVGYGRWPVLADVSCHVRPGEILGLTGDNAVGKTSIFRGLFSDGAWIRGGIAWRGARVANLRTAVVNGAASWVRQDRPIFARLTIDEALRAVASARSRPDRREQLERVLARTPELRPLLDRPMEHLSGGERALASLGIGLVNEPVLLCLDEPAANLSDTAQERVRNVIVEYVSATGAACIVIEHRIGLFASVASTLLELRRPEEPLP